MFNERLEHPRTTRLHHLDNLRVAAIILVVAHHAAQPYGPADWWYVRGDRRVPGLAGLSAVDGAFLMSLLFLVAGHFTPGAVERHGIRGFLRGRLRRLGVPLLVGTATVIPTLMYWYYRHYRGYPAISFPRYYVEVFLGHGPRPAGWTGPSWPDLQFGHLWFIQNLLALDVCYVLYLLVRRLSGRLARRNVPDAPGSRGTPGRQGGPGGPAVGLGPRSGGTPGHRALAGFVVVLAAVGYLVRIRYPLDTWIPLLGFVQTEPARLPQYVACYAAGILAHHRGWLRRPSRRVGYPWLAAGAGLAGILLLTGTGTRYFADGGASPAALCRVGVEAVICVGLCTGLPVLFHDVARGANRLSRELAAGSYAVYLVHLPVIVALQAVAARTDAPAVARFAAVVTLGVPASLAAGALVRRLPGARTVL